MTDMTLEAMDPQNDVSWFAYDSTGQLGYFATMGTGPLHPAGLGAMKSDLDFLYAFFDSLPTCSNASPTRDYLETTRAKDPMRSLSRGGWLSMAGHGLFAYYASNWLSYPSDYLLVAKPDVPLRFDKLPVPIQSKMRSLRIDAVFGTSNLVTVANLLDSGARESHSP